MDRDRSVQELYELFPYPQADPDLAPVLDGRRVPAWNPRDCFPVYFPEDEPRGDLDILVAGCGTNTAQQHAARLPDARIVAIDISEASLAQARGVAERFGLRNIEFHRLPLEEVATLGRTFDYVTSHGVLHHLADPMRGLRALGDVLRPSGAMSLMLYAKYGRTGVYMLQELFRDRLGMRVTREDLGLLQRATPLLPPGHPFRMIHERSGETLCFEELADLLLHPRDVAYAVEDVRRLVDGAGLRFHRWMAQAHFEPEASALRGTGLDARVAALDAWERWAAMELFHGKLVMHHFVVTHPSRRTARELFTRDSVVDAVPTLGAHVTVAREGDAVVLRNTQHQVPIAARVPLDASVSMLKALDGKRTVAQVADAVAASPGALREQARELFWSLHLADAVDLRVPATAR